MKQSNTVRPLHCWADYRESIEERYGYLSDAWFALVWEKPTQTCLRPAGHDGPHVWTPDSHIGITFTADGQSGEGV